ncbi:beta-ketoacyl-[acyl-carrier-protein] synthase family protein [Amycolatopsis sp. cmx-8-4]|uniref:beta-ketoacyl-[acyl-carrier-protein] synthase family protein n=1 Tax=Amycolatopsis sp. cmx-8-4 TaxID=2790947 RepID=UPI00397A4F94
MQPIAVTGLGVESCVGSALDGFWSAVRSGRSGHRALPRDVAEASGCAVGGVVDFEAPDVVSESELRRMSRFQQMHLAVVHKALLDAGVMDCAEHALVCGTSLGGFSEMPALFSVRDGVWRSTDRLAPLKILSHTPATVAAQVLGLGGRCLTIGTACAASTDAIALACDHIALGRADQVVASGVECWISPLALRSFSRLGAVSKRSGEEAAIASRPFDVDRDGLVPAEGAAALHLESLTSAVSRGARIYGLIVGTGSTCDAHHPTRPLPDGQRAAQAMRIALSDAGIEPSAVDHVDTHGTSTKDNDPVEALAIRAALGAQADRITLSAGKSVLGHTLGACGALETAAALLALRNGFAPPIANLLRSDPGCGMELAGRHGVAKDIRVLLKINLGFGGHNSALVLRPAPDAVVAA